LFAGATNWLSPQSLELAWHDARPGPIPKVGGLDVSGVPESEAFDDTQALAMFTTNVLALDIGRDSSLYDGDAVYLRQQRSIPYLMKLEEMGVLHREATLTLEDGRVHGYYWSVAR
jgi:hypothetical protein